MINAASSSLAPRINLADIAASAQKRKRTTKKKKKKMDKINSDLILNNLKELVESKKSIPRELWLEAAFKLNLLRIDEAQLYNKMRLAVAKKKFEILKNQEKKNVTAAKVEVEASDEYLFMKDQEAKMYSIEEFVRIAKKNADLNY